jgi:hypothetical protein
VGRGVSLVSYICWKISVWRVREHNVGNENEYLPSICGIVLHGLFIGNVFTLEISVIDGKTNSIYT